MSMDTVKQKENVRHKDDHRKFEMTAYVTLDIGKSSCGSRLICTLTVPHQKKTTASTTSIHDSLFFIDNLTAAHAKIIGDLTYNELSVKHASIKEVKTANINEKVVKPIAVNGTLKSMNQYTQLIFKENEDQKLAFILIMPAFVSKLYDKVIFNAVWRKRKRKGKLIMNFTKQKDNPTIKEVTFINSKLTKDSSKIRGNGTYAMILNTNWYTINAEIFGKYLKENHNKVV